MAIVCIWASDGKTPPKVAYSEQPSMAICKANTEAFKAQLEADPVVGFVNVVCVELDKGNKV